MNLSDSAVRQPEVDRTVETGYMGEGGGVCRGMIGGFKGSWTRREETLYLQELSSEEKFY